MATYCRLLAVAAVAMLGTAMFSSAGWARDTCVCLVSNQLNTGQAPVRYQYRSCLRNGKCSHWKTRTFKQGNAFGIKVICNTDRTFRRYQVRYDRSYAPGIQLRVQTLTHYKSFTVGKDQIPTCGCMPRAQYRFVKQRSGVRLYYGRPGNIAPLHCRINSL